MPTPVALSTGVTLDVHDVGPRDAPALVFLHGFPESWRTWRHQVAALADRYRCIAPDQRGYGASSKPPAVADYAPDKLAADIFALADALGIERFTVVGHDWGGVIAWIVATLGQFSRRVPRAVIANAPHPTPYQRLLYLDRAQRESSQYIRLFRDPATIDHVREHGLASTLVRAFSRSAPPARGIGARLAAAGELARGALGILGNIEPAEAAALYRRWQDGEAAVAMLNWYRASPVVVPAPDEPYALPAELPPAAPPLTIPTLVLWGEDDFALPPVNLDDLPAQVPDVRIVRLPGVGHFSPWQAPGPVTAALAAFLEETAAVA
ncbi:MAG: alpha/beta hydrolase [Sphingomonadales bacterium]|nr:alpha/beta hydrolase [Sphingomonadales bacterium]